MYPWLSVNDHAPHVRQLLAETLLDLLSTPVNLANTQLRRKVASQNYVLSWPDASIALFVSATQWRAWAGTSSRSC